MAEILSELPAEFETDLATALGAFAILAPFAFSFAGEPPIAVGLQTIAPSWPNVGVMQPDDPALGSPLARAIQTTFYDRCYAHRLDEPWVETDAEPKEDPAFARSLIEANSGRERWDPGWLVCQFAGNEQILVRKGGYERAATLNSFSSDVVPGMPLHIGASVSLHAPREVLGRHPGYYFILGEALDGMAEQLSLVRFYFHCGTESAAPLLATITSMLNRFQVPFQLKAPMRRALYGRTDAVVLYVADRYFDITARAIDLIRRSVVLSPSIPLFAKRLWPGIGVAVEPGTGESFGLHRCRLAAEGVVDAWREGKQDVSARLTAVAARFAVAGLDLARPYLGRGQVDLFLPPSPARLP